MLESVINYGGKQLIVQKTGWGKSIIYFIITKILRDSGKGPTLLISPLLSLMRNQILNASNLGIQAESINYSNTNYKSLCKMRKKVQMIFQIPRSALNLKMPVIKMLHEASKLGNPFFTKFERRKIIYDTLIGTGFIGSHISIDEFNNHKLVQSINGNLSGGERRRVSIAKAMVMNPDLIIADEPLASLDASLKASVLQYLVKTWEKRRNTENPLTMVLISHDIGIVSRVCSRVIIMYGDHINKRGEIVEDFRPPSKFNYLSNNSYHPYTKKLISAAKYFRAHAKDNDNEELESDKQLLPNQGCVYGSVCSDKSDECEEKLRFREVNNDIGHFTKCVKQI